MECVIFERTERIVAMALFTKIPKMLPKIIKKRRHYNDNMTKIKFDSSEISANKNDEKTSGERWRQRPHK